jgi:hypothetical protein
MFRTVDGGHVVDVALLDDTMVGAAGRAAAGAPPETLAARLRRAAAGDARDVLQCAVARWTLDHCTFGDGLALPASDVSARVPRPDASQWRAMNARGWSVAVGTACARLGLRHTTRSKKTPKAYSGLKLRE